MMVERTVKRRLLLAPALALALAACGGREAESGAASAGIPEQQVFFSDMLEAYEAGRLEEARALARDHLAKLERFLAAPANDLEAESGVRRTLALLRSLLQAESAVEPGRRLGPNREFIDRVDRAAVEARDAGRRLVRTPAPVRDFIEAETASMARALLQAKQGVATPKELEETYELFRDELAKRGYPDMESALRGGGPVAAPSPAAPVSRRATAAESRAIRDTVRDYLEALTGGNLARLADATGETPQACARLLRDLREDLNEEGIEKVHAVAVGSPPAEGWELRHSAAGPGEYFVLIRGIELDVSNRDGTRETRRIEKAIRLREGSTGRWLVQPPRSGRR